MSTSADGYEDLRDAIANGELLRAEHGEIVEAIAGRDPDAAGRAMQRHLLHVAEALRAHAEVEPSEAAAAGGVPD